MLYALCEERDIEEGERAEDRLRGRWLMKPELRLVTRAQLGSSGNYSGSLASEAHRRQQAAGASKLVKHQHGAVGIQIHISDDSAE